MTIRTKEIDAYQNEGAVLTLGSSQVLSFTEFDQPVAGELTYQDDAPRDQEWDFGESATFEGEAATLQATGTAFAGVNVTLLGIDLLTVQLSTPVQVAVFSADGEQYLRFFNADGSDADPQELLDALATDLVAALNDAAIPIFLQPLVNAILIDPLTFVQQNALLTFDLSAGAGMPTAPCFTAGTLILTRRGEVAAADLRPGDEVLTVDRGYRPIRWIGCRRLSELDLILSPHLRPIRIAPGALGEGQPERPLIMSPQHRCLVRSAIAARMVGTREVLIAAKHLTGVPGIEVMNGGGPVLYVHFLLDRHELVFSDGAITESFYLGEQAVAALDDAQRNEVLELFPELATREPHETPDRARTFMSGHIARKLVERGLKNGKSLIDRKDPVNA